MYLHDGAAYAVKSLDWDGGRATVSPTDDSLYTRASSTTSTRPTRVDATRPAVGAVVSTGELEVRSRATAYRRIRFHTHETVGWGEIDLPEHVHVAGAYWFALDAATLATLEAEGLVVVDEGDRGPSWPAQRHLALERDEHRCRRCGAPERPSRGHDVHHVQPYRSFRRPDGAYDHEAANAVDNLLTLCRPCHRATENATGVGGALSGAAYALSHVASLHLMCDPRDLGRTAELRPSWASSPTMALYERQAAGVGFGPALFELHEEIVAGARDLVGSCPCAAGCPSCVGAVDDTGPDARARTMRFLDLLSPPEPGVWAIG